MNTQKDKNSICFIGDLIFGDQPSTFGYGACSTWNPISYKDIFTHTKRELRNSGVVIGNFECTVSEDIPDKNKNLNNYMMCCGSGVCRELYENNIRIVSVANNHTFDYGPEGYKRTTDALRSHNIRVIGDRKNPYVIINPDNPGRSVAVIACSYIKIKHYEEAPYLLNPTSDEWKRILDEVRGKADHIIAYVHWGNEFVRYPTEMQRNIASELISMGVDDIIGCHPHILQSMQNINGHRIYYSIGNFVSDYWQRRLRYSVILRLNNDTLDIKEIPCFIDGHSSPHLLKQTSDGLIKRSDRISKNTDIFTNRNIVRVEYLTKMIVNFRKVRGKRALVKWIFERAFYFIKNAKEEVRNPDVVYQKFEVKQ